MVEYRPYESTVSTRGNKSRFLMIEERHSVRSNDLSAASAAAKISAPTDQKETLACFELCQSGTW